MTTTTITAADLLPRDVVTLPGVPAPFALTIESATRVATGNYRVRAAAGGFGGHMITRYWAPDQPLVLRHRPTPALDLDRLQANTAAAAETADQVVCTNTACTEAHSRREECTCTECDGEGHGVEVHRQIQGGRAAWTARTDVVRDSAGRRTGLTRAMVAALGDDEIW